MVRQFKKEYRSRPCTEVISIEYSITCKLCKEILNEKETNSNCTGTPYGNDLIGWL